MPESSHARKLGVLGRYDWEKEVEICGKEGKDSSAKVLKSLKAQKHPFFLSNRCDGPLLLNEHGDLYFSLHKNIVHIILLNLEKKTEYLSDGKKRYSRKRAQNHYSNMQILTSKTTILQPLYMQILYDIVVYAPLFLPVKFLRSVTLIKYVSS